ncbi:hypothetical protein AGMMS49965_11290 [Bacteroidia bacterium]|nr:hypothetical protein AGMMS49965_11290 [Bacteroidia bacterium]
MTNRLENYTRLNNAFKKTLVFRVGIDAGFFSEYIDMILAMLYCLDNKIKFTLYSKGANFSYEKGWTDYFLPFCEEEHNLFHSKCNFKRYHYKKLTIRVFLRYLYAFIFHLFHKDIFLTVDKYLLFHNKQFEQKHFYIPELGIDGDLQSAIHVLIDLTWHHNASTRKNIDDLIASLHLPEHYIGFHIRSGDKIIETELFAPTNYIELAQKHFPQWEHAFVLTDNYLVIDELKQIEKRNFYTLCGKEERGYFHRTFQKQDKTVIRQAQERLFASVDVLSKSDIFIGTFSSGPSGYLNIRMPKGKAFSLDKIN